MSKPPIKRLFWDIETSPNIGVFWKSSWKMNIPHDNIIQERAIICICYKWEGKKRVHHLEWDKGCDKQLVKEFLKIGSQADELVAHNGDNFDLKWFNGRVVKHGFKAPSIWKTIDTLKIARRRFALNSNRLDYLGKYLFGEGKTPTTFGLWKDILLQNCPKAMRSMVDYCKQDVKLLERVYERVSPFHPMNTHAGVMIGNENWSCSRCGSENVKSNGSRVSVQGYRRHMMVCNDCHGHTTISPKAYKHYAEFKHDQRAKKNK